MNVEEMTLRKWPDPVLMKRAAEVTTFDEDLAVRVERMWDVMYESNGIGLAAPQVGWSVQVLVLNPTSDREKTDEARVIINPRVVKRWGKETAQEGCLSFPEIFVDVLRPRGVRLAWQDETGAQHEEDLNDLPARIAQHEFDHLEGVLLAHRMSPVDKIRYRRELESLAAEHADA